MHRLFRNSRFRSDIVDIGWELEENRRASQEWRVGERSGCDYAEEEEGVAFGEIVGES